MDLDVPQDPSQDPSRDPSNSPGGTTAAVSASSPRKRRRTRVACEPCRERKRKCNGGLPCHTCVHFDYDCYYATPKTVKRKRIVSSLNTPEDVQQQSTTTAEDNGTYTTRGTSPVHHTNNIKNNATNHVNSHIESLEANSGAAFVRRLGLKIDPSNAPRLDLFGWNVGDRLAGCPPGTPRNVTSILNKVEMGNLAFIYFEKVSRVYGILDRDTFFHRMEKRWRNPNIIDTYDPVLCGVVAFGLLFSQKFPTMVEPDLIETARTLLEQHSQMTLPSIDTVTGWILRVAYLRMTSLPHATWLASCTMMHIVEATGIHVEAPSATVFNASLEKINVDIRRRLFGMAQHLNIWASFDLGRSKITLPGASREPVVPNPGEYTAQLLALLPQTESLDPNKTRSVEDLEADMSSILADECEEAPVVMAKVNLMLCIFRRLRDHKSNILNLQADRILTLATQGLRAAQQMTIDNCPWHHVANIPFQVACFALAIDSRASLALVGDAMRTLQLVANTWNSAVMREAYNTAYLLVVLHQRRKEEDAKTLRDVLSMHSTTAPAITSDSSPAYQLNNGGVDNYQQQIAAATAPPPAESTAIDSTTTEFSWLEDLIANMPSLREFDLEQFLVQDATQPQDLGSIMDTGFTSDPML